MTISHETIKNIIESHSTQIGLVDHQTRSYEQFLTHGIEEILTNNAFNLPSRRITFSDVYIPKPTVTEEDRIIKDLIPADARIRDLTYDSPVYISITDTKLDDNGDIISSDTTKRVEICRIPIMLRTSFCHLHNKTKEQRVQMRECEYDNGGYFIVRGNERVLVSQLRSMYNLVLVFAQTSDRNSKYDMVAETRSMSYNTGHSVMIRVGLNTDNRTIDINLPYIKDTIPIGIVLKALGYQTEQDMKTLIKVDSKDIDKYIRYIHRDSYIGEHSITTDDVDERKRIISEAAFEYIGKQSLYPTKQTDLVKYGEQIITTELLPHMGISATSKSKAMFIGHMLSRLLSTKLGMRTVDDIDDYAYKRVETPGILCNELFKQLFKKFKESITATLEKKKQNNVDVISLMNRNNTITSGLRHCFSTGNWGVPKTSYIRPGVSQILSRLSYGASLSHMRRVCIPVGKEAKNTKIRQINSSQIMFICPCETPEGQPVGIVLNLTIMARVSESTAPYLIHCIINKCPNFINIDEDGSEENTTNLFLNGTLIGTSDDPYSIVEDLRKHRMNGSISHDVSISYNDIDDEINIACDAGRLIRPVFNVDKDKVTITDKDGSDWNDLVDKSLITYLDNAEINNKVIAFNQKELGKYRADHCEIDASMILGVMGSIIPWPDHSQSPRNCYQTSMGKQAMSMYALSFNHRADTISHVLGYPQKPLVTTHQAGLMGFNEMPSGVNAIVAIACYTGFNQEDSVLINKSAVQRGLFGATSYRTHTDQEKKHGIHSSEKIGCIPLDKRKMDLNYSLLGPDGIIMTRFANGRAVYVDKGDVLIGKYFIDSSRGEGEIISDISLVIKKGEEGFVDRIIKTTTPDGNIMVKVVIRTDRTPEVGDKFASRAAQKGTCGMLFNQEDMPWTVDGICPDIIINPHCIPSRMTINQLMETVLGKSAALSGKIGDATPFSGTSEQIGQQVCDQLGLTGYERTGLEVLYNGFTGEPMGTYFIGPVYYQRLKHLVSEKIHARAGGPVTTLTRQPLEGRSRDGGLRFGEMERDCMVSHGTSMFLKDRLCDQSDPYKIPVCEKCGNIATSHTKCVSCGYDQVSIVGLPYVCKLVLQELNTMCLKTKITVK
jgi:DNA-directed RNA polymerase II subunit RPB2